MSALKELYMNRLEADELEEFELALIRVPVCIDCAAPVLDYRAYLCNHCADKE